MSEQRYYAHPQNQFWRLLGHAIGEELSTIDYADRLSRLAKRRIALWDVVAEARRSGSLDGAIRSATPNQLRQYVASHSHLRGIAFNGKTAARLGRRALGSTDHVRLIDLPSSSPAYTLAFPEKARLWDMLGALACPPEAATLE